MDICGKCKSVYIINWKEVPSGENMDEMDFSRKLKSVNICGHKYVGGLPSGENVDEMDFFL